MATKRKKKRYDRVIGIDLGNGMVKVRGLDLRTGLPYELVLPSAWAYKEDAGVNVHRKELDLDTFYIGDREYVWGNDIPKIDKINNTYGLDNRYKTEAFKIMAKIVMAKVVFDLDIKPTEKILIVTGVPSAESNTDKEEDIRMAFMGENEGLHEVDVNETEEGERIFKVAHVEVMSQALSAVIGRYLDEDGFVGDDEYERIKVGVIDIGAGTIDLDVIDCLIRLKGYTSVPVGFRVVYNAIRDRIAETYSAHAEKVTDYELIDCLESRKYKPSNRAKEIDFSKAMDNGLEKVIVAVQQAIMSKWEDQIDMDEILLIGASAKEFEDRLSNVIEGLTIPTNSEMANVEGYYRWGMYLLLEEEDDE